jgi:GWxTD domain-containing protein
MFKMKYLLLMVLLEVSFAFSASSMENLNLKFNVDYGRFRYDSTSVYLEVYYTVFSDQTNNVKNMAEEAQLNLNFTVYNAEQDSVLAQDQIPVKFTKTSVGDESGSLGAMGMVKLVLDPGKYVISLSHGEDEVKYDVSVGAFSGDHIMMSDLELCSNIITKSKNQDNLFYKNTMEIYPNPSLIYGKMLPRLYYYVELYNLDNENAGPNDKVLVQAVIADADGKVRLQKDYVRSHDYESTVERGAFNVSNLETGLYTLIFAATDSVNKSSVYRRRNFYVHNPDVVLAQTDEGPDGFLQSEFRDMPEQTIDEMFDQARYLASNSEKSVYKVLNSVESKREFLYRFWKSQNKNRPGLKDEYYERVGYANEQWSSPSREGWQTDRGRVYILYGEPDQYERRPVGASENPYEIWYYNNLQGGVEFDFIDQTGFGDYKLVNSTMRDELSDPNWRNYILKR